MNCLEICYEKAWNNDGSVLQKLRRLVGEAKPNYKLSQVASEGTMSQIFLSPWCQIPLKSKLSAFSYVQNGFLRTPRRNEVNS